MIRIIIATIVLLSLQEFSKATRDVDLQGLIQNRRSFLNYAEEGKLEAYLSSFGSSPNQSEIHEIFKRSPKRKVRKAKKGSTTTTTESPVVVEIPMKRLKSKKNGKNVDQSQRDGGNEEDDEDDEPIVTVKPTKSTPHSDWPKAPQFMDTNSVPATSKQVETTRMNQMIGESTESPVVVEIPMKRLKSKKNGKNVDQSQRVTFKFGLEDAKYDEAYERLKKSRKIRVKRSSDIETNDRNKKAFVQPTEVLKFSIQDAVIKSPFESEDKDTKESEIKTSERLPFPQPEIKESIVMRKSVYFYKNDENYDKKNSMTSPGPVLFEDSIPTTPSPMIVAHLTMKTTFIIHQLLASPLNMQLLL
ncbi:CLUMA_CG018244, isoform A [Clunio marinus]|uniref:CLUMA_CG018244, isoform A n=1 Tax=Clunio marinus TaxID=568069 RepID=A0A1J1J1N1_9DIPT|nr:CLUMA_CG018244, isoform A [Clunio marinus]